MLLLSHVIFFFFNDPATTEIYTLSLHDALPIFAERGAEVVLVETGLSEQVAIVLEPDVVRVRAERAAVAVPVGEAEDRKSTRLNSSHMSISYAVFCLKKKKKIINNMLLRTIEM